MTPYENALSPRHRDMLFCLRPILTAAGYPDPDMRKIVITDSSIREFSTYDGLTQAILDHDMPERTGTTVLDHYTDGGFKGIMQSQALWLAPITLRSEEHTSELQSLMRISYAVFCLKKKQNQNTTHTKKYIYT